MASGKFPVPKRVSGKVSRRWSKLRQALRVSPMSYFEIVFAVLKHFWWRKCCQKRGGKWNCNRRREAIIGSQVQEIMPKGA
jgi:hypothetical protein